MSKPDGRFSGVRVDPNFGGRLETGERVACGSGGNDGQGPAEAQPPRRAPAPATLRRDSGLRLCPLQYVSPHGRRAEANLTTAGEGR